MAERIMYLKESPCYQCHKHMECMMKTQKNNQLYDIVDQVFGNKGFDYHNCPIYVALTAPDMVDETENEVANG